MEDQRRTLEERRVRPYSLGALVARYAWLPVAVAMTGCASLGLDPEISDTLRIERVDSPQARIASVQVRDHGCQLAVSGRLQQRHRGRNLMAGHLHIEALAQDGAVLCQTVTSYQRLSPKLGISEFSQRLAVASDQVRSVRVIHHPRDEIEPHSGLMRGTFANSRLRNRMAPGTEGGVTRRPPSGEPLCIYDAALRYQAEGVPVIMLAGKEYGSGFSRAWAAKGPRLLGVRAVIAESDERIHRSNLVRTGVLPLELTSGASAQSLGLSGTETVDILGLENGEAKEVQVRATAPDGRVTTFTAKVRIDTPTEVDNCRNGGILPYVVRRLAA